MVAAAARRSEDASVSGGETEKPNPFCAHLPTKGLDVIVSHHKMRVNLYIFQRVYFLPHYQTLNSLHAL